MDQAAQELITRHNETIRELIVRDIETLERRLNVKRQVSRKADEAMDKVKGTLGMNQRHDGEGWAGFARHNAAPLLAVGLGGVVLARNLRERTGSDSQSSTTRLVTESSYVPHDEATSDRGGLQDRASAKLDDVKASTAEGLDAAKGRVSEVTDTAKAKVGDVTDTAKERVSEVTDTAKAKVTGAKESMTGQAVHAKDVVIERIPSRQEAKRAAHDHNQLLGLAALAAGAIAGTFVPRTRAEERRLAPVQAQVKDKASHLVEDSVEKAKETADRAAEAISAGAETAKEEFAETGDDQPPSGDLPDLTRPNRITGSRSSAPTGVDGGGY